MCCKTEVSFSHHCGVLFQISSLYIQYNACFAAKNFEIFTCRSWCHGKIIIRRAPVLIDAWMSCSNILVDCCFVCSLQFLSVSNLNFPLSCNCVPPSSPGIELQYKNPTTEDENAHRYDFIFWMYLRTYIFQASYDYVYLSLKIYVSFNADLPIHEFSLTVDHALYD